MSDIQTVRVVDSRLKAQEDLKFAVHEGAQAVSYQLFQANSVGSQIVFNVQIPSQSTCVDKKVLFRSQVNLQVLVNNTSANVIPTAQFFGFGGANPTYNQETGLAPFALQSCFTTIQSTINNTNIPVNIQDILELIVRLQNLRSVSAKINSTTPIYPDQYQTYNSAVGLNNDPLGGYGNTTEYVAPRGSYKISYSPQNIAANTNNQPVSLSFEVAEPLLISPWIWCYEYFNQSAMYGLTNLNFVMNAQTAPTRCIRTTLTTTATPQGISLAGPFAFQTEPFTLGKTYLEFMFLSPKPSQIPLLNPKNSHLYYELPRYLQTGAGTVQTGASLNFVSPVIQLNNIPDVVYCWCRKRLAIKTNSDPDFTLPLADGNPLSIQFNNNVGILSTATSYELYRMALNNGLQTDWQQWSGVAEIKTGTAVQEVSTAGPILALAFGQDIQIPEMYLAPGSIGNFNLQLNIAFKNNTGAIINGTDYELVIVTMNSGVLINAAGSTQSYLSILTKDDVVAAVAKEPYTKTDVQRLVGGSFWDTLKSVAGAVLPVVKAVGSVIPNPTAQLVSKGIGALGYGMAGAGMAGAGEAGAGMAGGRKRKDMRLA